jgi:hypothetical protein
MRLPVLAAVLLVLATAPASAVGAPGPASTEPPTAAVSAVQQSSLSGTVSYLNGTPVAGATVLVGSQDRLGKATTDELRALAADPPANVTTATTDEDGAYSLTVNDTAEAVVAVTDAGVSRLRRYDPGELDLTLRTTEPLAFESTPVTSEPGGRATVTFSLDHGGERAVEGLKLTLGSLPDGWNIARTSSGAGTFHDANNTFVWGTVEPGATVTAGLTLFVAIEAIDNDSERFTFPMFAGSETHPVSADSVEVTVQYPTERTRTDLPGLGAPAAVVALAALAGALLARRD